MRLLCVLALDRFGDFVSDQARSKRWSHGFSCSLLYP